MLSQAVAVLKNFYDKKNANAATGAAAVAAASAEAAAAAAAGAFVQLKQEPTGGDISSDPEATASLKGFHFLS